MKTRAQQVEEILDAVDAMGDLEPYLETLSPRVVARTLPMLIALFAYKLSTDKRHFNTMLDSALKPIIENRNALYNLLETNYGKDKPPTEI